MEVEEKKNNSKNSITIEARALNEREREKKWYHRVTWVTLICFMENICELQS